MMSAMAVPAISTASSAPNSDWGRNEAARPNSALPDNLFGQTILILLRSSELMMGHKWDIAVLIRDKATCGGVRAEGKQDNLLEPQSISNPLPHSST